MSWNGVKKQSIKVDIEAWCEEMGIRNYTINSQCEIDVDGCVDFRYNENLKELPYKFGSVSDYFSLSGNKSLTSLKNCPDFVGTFFSCSLCLQLDSLEECPKKVIGNFYCNGCKKKFTKEEVQSLCNVKKTKICV